MFDLHAQHMLLNAFKLYRDNQAYFESMFPEISQSLRTKYYELYISKTPRVDKAYKLDENASPQIVITEAQNNLLNTQLLSNGGHKKKTMLLRNDLILNVYAPSSDYVRILHRLIQSAFLSFKRSFLQIGYLNVDFIASNEHKPADDTDLEDLRNIRSLSSENIIMYRRELIYSAQKLLEVEPLPGQEDFEVDVDFIMNVPRDINDTTSEDLYTKVVYTTK